jgi:hypothetical protein
MPQAMSMFSRRINLLDSRDYALQTRIYDAF